MGHVWNYSCKYGIVRLRHTYISTLIKVDVIFRHLISYPQLIKKQYIVYHTAHDQQSLLREDNGDMLALAVFSASVIEKDSMSD